MISLRIPNGQTFKGKGCADLHVRVTQTDYGLVHESLWEPTPVELEILKAGGRVMISMLYVQAPTKVTVVRGPK